MQSERTYLDKIDRVPYALDRPTNSGYSAKDSGNPVMADIHADSLDQSS